MMFPSDPREIAPFIARCVSAWERDAEVRILQTEMHEGFNIGRHWIVFNPIRGSVERDPQLIEGYMPNYTRLCVNLAVATMTQQKFTPEAFPTIGGSAAQRSAKAGTTILGDIYRQNGGQAGVKRFCNNLMIRGNNFMRVEVDPNGLNTVVLDPIELDYYVKRTGQQPLMVSDYDMNRKAAIIKTGRIVQREVHPSCVSVQPGVNNFNDAIMFCVTSYKPISEIRAIAEKYGADPEKVRRTTIRDIRRPGQGSYYPTSYLQGGVWQSITNSQEGYRFDQDAELGKLIEFWYKDGSGMWYVLYCCNDACDLYLGYEGGFVIHPYVHFKCWEQPSLLWGMSHQVDLVEPNRAIDKIRTLRVNSFERQLKNVWLFPRGSDIAGVDDSLGDYFVEYSGSGNVQYLQASSNVFQYLMAEEDRMLRSMMELAGISEVSRGNIPDRVSTESVALALKRDSTTLEELYVRIQESYCEVWRKELFFAKHSAIFDLPTIMSQIGPDQMVGAIEFRDTDIRGDLIVEAKAGPPRLETPREIAEDAQRLFATGFFAVGPGMDEARKKFELYKNGGSTVSTVPETERLAEQGALMENLLFKRYSYDKECLKFPTVEQPDAMGNMIPVEEVVDGRTGMPLFDDWQMHSIHVEQHMIVIQDPTTPPDVRWAMLKHIPQHYQAMDKQMQSDKQMQNSAVAENSVAQSMGPAMVTQQAAIADRENARIESLNDDDGDEGGSGRDKKKAALTPAQGGVKSGEARRQAG